MRILITGGAGYLGSVLVEKMFAAKSEHDNYFHHFDKKSHFLNFNKIIVYDNLLYKQNVLLPFCYRNNFEFVYGDVRNYSLLKKNVEQADIIIPLAAIVGFPACDADPLLAKQVNYEHVKFVVDNLRKDQQIILPVTNSQYGTSTDIVTEETPVNPLSIYAKTKCDAESVVMDSGQGISLRLATVFGLSQRMRLDLLVNDFTYKAIRDGYIVLFEHKFNRNYIHLEM